MARAKAKPASRRAESDVEQTATRASRTPGNVVQAQALTNFVASNNKIAEKFGGFKIARQVTMPVMKMEIDTVYGLQIDSAIRLSTYVAPAKKDKDGNLKQEDPAHICNVTDVETGACFTFLVPAVVQKNLEENYPDESYVGKVFAMQKLPQRPGKRYYDFNIVEMQTE